MLMFFSQRNRGFSFVEVVIALFLAAVVSIILYGSSIYTMRQTAKSVEQISGIQLASSAAARVRAASYARLVADSSTLGNNEFEKQFFTAPTPTRIDPLHPHSTQYTLNYAFSGYGRGCTIEPQTGGYPTIDMEIPEGGAHWVANQYEDHFLVVTGGRGANQLMYIVSHEASRDVGGDRRVRLVLTQALDGASAVDWAVEPNSTSVFAVDYGLYCDIEVTWGDGTGAQLIQETVYVPAS